MLALTFLITLSICTRYLYAYDNGVAATPPMGWSTWCTKDACGLRDRCSEYEVRRRVDAMVEQGMRDLGYEWILLDDCWSDHERDANGELQPNPIQFPSGMAALADYIHLNQMKLGLYTCVGTETCKKDRPGSYGYYERDANTLAGWGVDMIKADYCHKPSNETGQSLYSQFSAAINATGRPILFAMCQWGNDEVWEWGGEISQMYRIQMDHIPFYNWPATASGAGYGCGTHQIINWMADLNPSKYNAPHAWMDPDFLETLFPITMNYIDSRTEFSFWALWASPLFVATEVLDMSDEKKSILMNTEVLDVHSDPLFISGSRIYNRTDGSQAWQRPLQNGDVAVILYNGAGLHSNSMAISFSELGWDEKSAVSVRNLWTHEDVGVFVGGYIAHNVSAHDIEMLRMSKVK